MRASTGSTRWGAGTIGAVLLLVLFWGPADALSVDWWRTHYGSGSWSYVNGLWFRYDSLNRIGYWRSGTQTAYGKHERYMYRWAELQWYMFGDVTGPGKLPSATVLGTRGVTDFLIDGKFHNIGSSYYFAGFAEYGIWSRDGTAAGARYMYLCAPSVWKLRGYDGVWNILGAPGRYPTFIGNSFGHDMGNGYWYWEHWNKGYWNLTYSPDDEGRYIYYFATGEWRVGWTDMVGITSYRLSAAGLGSRFMADGAYHNLKNGYYFVANLNYAFWSTAGGYTGVRYRYDFGRHDWALRGYGNAWNLLSQPGLSPEFVGDGKYHALGLYGSYYYYRANLGYAWWSVNGTDAGLRYAYRFVDGQWLLRGYDETWQVLGTKGKSSSFMGDGKYHALGSYVTGSWFYRGATDAGYWSTSGTSAGDSYKYLFATGLWNHKGAVGQFHALGTAGRSAAFVGDGVYHRVSAYYYRRAASAVGYWSVDGTAGGDRYFYRYDTSGQWASRASATSAWTSIATGKDTGYRNP